MSSANPLPSRRVRPSGQGLLVKAGSAYGDQGGRGEGALAEYSAGARENWRLAKLLLWYLALPLFHSVRQFRKGEPSSRLSMLH